MPTYDYLCQECGYEFERFQSITAKPIRKCPECGSNSVKRLIGCGSGVIFRGTGFYQTDYRTESYKKGQSRHKESSAQQKGEEKTDTAKTNQTDKTQSESKKKTA
ncbi:MAG: zinc ribbon domain-containing protein [Sedimentisphaerales bacterium]|nr:zinc ribbon domain-containing protein [Sedimentisphaerales bacterium]